jgi:hypothetical protein
MDVVVGRKEIINGDESMPYQATDAYAETKIEAEKFLLSKTNQISPKTNQPIRIVCIRPLGIWGERDPYHIKNVLDTAKTGLLQKKTHQNQRKFSGASRRRRGQVSAYLCWKCGSRVDRCCRSVERKWTKNLRTSLFCY